MATCKYQKCGRPGYVDEEGTCQRCGWLVIRVRGKTLTGRLPWLRNDPLANTLRMGVLRGRARGSPCAICDEPIHGDHFAYPEFTDPENRRKWELHFHTLCHEIWEREAIGKPS